MKARLTSATVVLQAITMLLALPVISKFESESSTNKTLVAVAAILLLLSPAIYRRSGGFLAGSALQLFALVVSFSNTTLLVLNVLFIVLWIVSWRLGERIERERREREQGLDSSQ